MTTNPKVDTRALAAFALAASNAATNVAAGDPDDLIVLGNDCPKFENEQDDDDVRAIASIDILRELVANYDRNRS